MHSGSVSSAQVCVCVCVCACEEVLCYKAERYGYSVCWWLMPRHVHRSGGKFTRLSLEHCLCVWHNMPRRQTSVVSDWCYILCWHCLLM